MRSASSCRTAWAFESRHAAPARSVALLVALSAVLSLVLPRAALAQTMPSVDSPVNYGGTPIATATYLEDHGGWHAGVDLPENASPTVLVNPQSGVPCLLGHQVGTVSVHAISVGGPTVNVGENSTILGAWQIQVLDILPKFMLDIISVQRVTSGMPVVSYTVSNVVESPASSGFSSGVVNLVVNFPSPADALLPTDTLAVTYAFYPGELRGFMSMTPAAGMVPISYNNINHLDNLHKFVSWNTYPATATNRFYDSVNVPAGRTAVNLTKGASFGEILQTAGADQYPGLPDHVHYTLFVGGLNFPTDAVNPFGGALPFNDPQGNRPNVRSFGLVRSATLATTPALQNGMPLYGDLEVFLECRDDMGATERTPDRDSNTVRETGVYNAGYWIDPFDNAVAPIGSPAAPEWLVTATTGIDVGPAIPLNTVALLADPLFRIDVNTNYHVWVSHVGLDVARLWRTNADVKDLAADVDGSGGAATLLNRESSFPDGLYRLGGIARDLVGLSAVRDTICVVDNYRPYVREVEIDQAGLPLYRGKWQADGTETKLDLDVPLLADRQLATAVANVPIEFKVVISESVGGRSATPIAGSVPFANPGATIQVRFDAANALKFDPQGGGATLGEDVVSIAVDSLITTYNTFDTIVGSATISDPGGMGIATFDGDAVLVVEIEDLSTDGTGGASGGTGNRLLAREFVDYVPATHQIDAATQLNRNAAGVMQGTAGQDKVHRFRIDTQPPTIEITVEGGT